MMASFKAGSLTKDNYLDWIEMVQIHAGDCGIWEFIDPKSTVCHSEPQKPLPSDYKVNATKFADLDKNEKEKFKEDNAQYQVDFQSFKQECRLIGDLRKKIVESVHEDHRKLILGHMTCRDVLKQISNILEPNKDLQRQKIIDGYSRIRITPASRKIDGWLMEWERSDAVLKRLKIAGFNDYNLTHDFLSAANPLQPLWVAKKRMEILKLTDKTKLRFIDILLEFREFWELTESEPVAKKKAFPAGLQSLESLVGQKQVKHDRSQGQNNHDQGMGEPKHQQCGELHPEEQPRYLAEEKVPSNFQKEKGLKKLQNACNRPQIIKFVKKSTQTAKKLRDFVDEKWLESGKKSHNPNHDINN